MTSVMTLLIDILRTYADSERVFQIVGSHKATGLKQFKYSKDDLGSISAITYEVVNPVAQTVGGRLQMVRDLIDAGQIKSPKQYMSVLSTGQVDTALQDDEADQMLILEENEKLRDGSVPVKAVITEMHMDHIKSHMSVLSSVAAKNDPALVERTLAHCQEHIDLWTFATLNNPGILFATGQQPIPIAPPQQPQVQPQGPNNIGPMVGSGQKSASQMKAEDIQPAQMPTNPLTGDKATVPGVTS